MEFGAVHGGEYHSPVNVATSPRPDDVPGAGVSDRQQSPTFFVPTRFSCAGGRARARGCSYSRAGRPGGGRGGQDVRTTRNSRGAQWGRRDRVRGTALGGTARGGNAWRAAPPRLRSRSRRTSPARMKPARASGPRDPSGASPPRRRSPASRCRRPGTVPRRRPAARSRARAPSGSDGSRPRSPKT